MSQSGYSPVSLDVQLIQFLDFHRRSQIVRKQGGIWYFLNGLQIGINFCLSNFFLVGGIFQQLLPEETVFSRALYVFDIGQNDLTAGYKLNMSTEQVKAYVPDVLVQLSNVIKVSFNLIHMPP